MIKDARKGVVLNRSLMGVVNSLPEGKYNIYIVEQEGVSTVAQNKLFWMWMTCLERWSGECRVKWHDYFVNTFLPKGRRSVSRLPKGTMQ